MNLKPKLFVLGVAIDKYALAFHHLKGCGNDLKGLEKYLGKYVDQELFEFKLRTLQNESATRQGVIDTFLSFFDDLENGDSALFYFSGHGSQAYTPTPFRHNTPGKLHETLVCYDSRIDSRDLYDKELSYLIWEVTKKKQIHFTVIVDCCHSESITRNTEEKEQDEQDGVRMMDADVREDAWDHYLGAAFYQQRGTEVHPPLGKHILIAACRRNEKAKERNIEFRPRGVFTYALLRALELTKGNLTYGNLIDRVRSIVFNYTIGQHPILESHGIENAHQQYFLSGAIKKQEKTFLLSYNPEKGWGINQGALHGLDTMPLANHLLKWYHKVLEDGSPDMKEWIIVPIERVYSTYASVKMPSEMDENMQFYASFHQVYGNCLPIGISSKQELKGLKMLNKAWEYQPPDWVQLLEKNQEASYIIDMHEGVYLIQKKDREHPLFKSPIGYTEKNARVLIKNISTIANWHRVKDIDNPLSSIRAIELKINFYHVTELSEDNLGVLGEEAISDFLSIPAVLPYRKHKITGEFEEPAFRLKFENPISNRRSLWVALLFLGADYSITNELCPFIMLQPGESHWVEAISPDTGMYTNVINLHLQKEFASWGLKSITEHFKILIATDEFDTHYFNQDGISLALNRDSNRELHRAPDIERSKIVDWKAIDFSIKVIKDCK